MQEKQLRACRVSFAPKYSLFSKGSRRDFLILQFAGPSPYAFCLDGFGYAQRRRLRRVLFIVIWNLLLVIWIFTIRATRP